MNNYNQYNRGGKMSPYKNPVPKYLLGGMLNQFFGSVLGGGGGSTTPPTATPPTTTEPSTTPPPVSCPPGWHWDTTQQICVEDVPVATTPNVSTPLTPHLTAPLTAPGGEVPIDRRGGPINEEQAFQDIPRTTELGPNQATGLSQWWSDRQKLLGIMEGRGRRGTRSVIDIRGPVKEGGSPGGAYEDLTIEEENPLIARGSPYLYKNVMGFQQGGRLNRENTTVTGEEFKSFNKSMAQIGLGIINSFGGKRAKGRFINGGKF